MSIFDPCQETSNTYNGGNRNTVAPPVPQGDDDGVLDADLLPGGGITILGSHDARIIEPLRGNVLLLGRESPPGGRVVGKGYADKDGRSNCHGTLDDKQPPPAPNAPGAFEMVHDTTCDQTTEGAAELCCRHVVGRALA